ncbi:hypothetical protein WME91_29030 [Sorangium sp. So ce269]
MTVLDHDVLGRRTLLVDPDKGTTRFDYNGLGDLYRKVEGGEETIYQHDVIGRVRWVTDVDGTTEYTWDTEEHGIGRLAATTSPDGTMTGYGYDEHGRLESLMWLVGGDTFKHGQEPAIQPWAGGRPGNAISWDEIPIDMKVWP